MALCTILAECCTSAPCKKAQLDSQAIDDDCRESVEGGHDIQTGEEN